MVISRYIRFLIIGIVFGVVLTKSEAISWFRIQEMFRFQSFHMFGIIGSALVVGILSTYLIKRTKAKNFDGYQIKFNPKAMSVPRYLIGGVIFGLGWALTGACPGPLYILIGNGYSIILVVLGSAIIGTYAYGALRHKLPH